jgi:serine/threonine protein kinase/Tol biopolymer transport system component
MAAVEKQKPASDRSDSSTAERQPLPAGTTIGRYRLLSLLGSGAMGDVYRAHDRSLEREVALKVLPPTLVNDRERVRRFAQEARAASALSHPHIVTTYEVGHGKPSTTVQTIHERRTSEVHYIAMEFIEGRTLREAFGAGLPLRRVVELLAQVADGLGKAHAAGIIHRDLKPENIIVANEGYAKIVDFGLAKLFDVERGWNPIGADSPTLRALTQQGEVLGTPGYMSPEQITGRGVDPRADVFSFGCILYEAIAKQKPFEAESFVDTLYKILHNDPEPVGDPELQRILAKCLAKNREERYQSIRDAALDLRQWLEPAKTSVPGRTSKWGLAVLAAAIVTAAILFHPSRSTTTPAALQSIRRMTTHGRATNVAISPDARYVAWSMYDPKGASLWVEQVETKSALQLLPPAHGRYAAVTFSRDGNYLYYVRYDDGQIATLNRLPILGGTPEAIVRDIDTRPAFSPDGAMLAFVRDDYNKSTSTLFVAKADGSGERVLSTLHLPDRALSPAWSPDGRQIVVARGGTLLAVAYPDGEAKELETKPRFASLKGVTWSPDGKTLLAAGAAEEGGEHARLWRIDAKSGEGTPMTDELSDVVLPSVSDDGTIAALQVVRQASLFQYDGSAIRPLTANSLGGLTWIGDRIVYASEAERVSSLWSIDPKSGQSSRLTGEALSALRPVATRDGSTIVFAAESHGQYSLWSMRADGTNRKQLTTGPRDADFAVSPDAKTLAWASIDPSTNEWTLRTMPVAGGAASLLVKRPTLIEQVRFSADGRTLLFTGYAGSMLRLYSLPVSGGKVTELTTKRSMMPELSPDGSTLACSYAFEDMNNAPLALMAPDGTNVRVLPVRGQQYQWRNDAVTYVRDDNGVTNLWQLDGKTPRRLTDFSEGSIADYAWSADGSRAAITHVVDSSDVVVIRQR